MSKVPARATSDRAGRAVLRELIAAIALLSLLAPVEALLLAGPAAADFTPAECDSTPKYWCYRVFYTPYSGYVSVDTVSVTGGDGYGGAKSWQRYITSLWRNDPGTTTWYDLVDYAPDPNVAPGLNYTDPPAWYTEPTVYQRYANVYPGYFVSDIAVVQVRTRYESNVDPGPGGGAYPPWCGDGVDFNLSQGGYYVVWGTAGC